jgi:hypothetical protein
MSPRRSRRRARRRSATRLIVVVGAVAVLVALLIGGLAEVSRQSQGYDATSNRTLAAQGGVVAEQSNATATSATALLGVIPSQNRVGLQIALDGLVQQSAGESTRADEAAGATTAGSLRSGFAAVFADRAEAMSQLRAAVDGYLGMRPMPVAGAPGSATPTDAGDSTLLSATQATNRIAAVGTLLARSDSLYRSVRRTLASAPGHGRLPKSAWVTSSGTWGLGAIAAQVDLIATSPSLAVTHYLALRTIRINPPALPTPQGGSSSVSVIAPTSQISVDAVLGNDGTVDEPHATVHFTLASQSSGATASHSETIGLAADASQALPTVNFHVKAGTTYVLTVSVDLPAGQTQTVGTAVQSVLQVAPAS